jgi:hypothetical protein
MRYLSDHDRDDQALGEHMQDDERSMIHQAAGYGRFADLDAAGIGGCGAADDGDRAVDDPRRGGDRAVRGSRRGGWAEAHPC